MSEGRQDRRPLPESVFEYARDQAWTARGLERHFEEALTPARWRAWTVAGPSVPDTRLAHFAMGGAEWTSSSARAACPAISEAMSRDSSAIFVLPDPLARPMDSLLRETQGDWFSLDDAVYHVERSADEERLRKTWYEPASVTAQMGMVTGEQLRPDTGRPTQEDLLRAAERATLVVISAYDGEGAIFFEPDR